MSARDFHGNSAAPSLAVLAVVNLTTGSTSPGVTLVAGHRFYVRGSGFGPSETVQITASIPLYNGNVTVLTKTATADSHGNLAEVLMQLPGGAKQNSVNLAAVGQSSKKKTSAALNIVYRPKIALRENVLRPGAAATVSGQGFVPGSVVHLTVAVQRTGAGSVTLARDVTSDAFGSFSTSIALPTKAQPGSYTISALDAVGKFAASIPLMVTLKPVLVLSAKSVAPGGTVKVTGGGFSANALVAIAATFRLIAGGSRTVTKSATTDANGSFTTSLTVPGHVSAGPVTVLVKGPNVQAGANLLVAVSPTTASPGQAVTVTGSGFSANVTVRLTINVPLYGGGSRTITTSVQTSAQGAFSTGLSIPQRAAAGSLTVSAIGPNTQAITHLAVGHLLPTVAASPASVIPGSSVAIQGSGFLAGTKVDVSVTVKDSSGKDRTLTTSATTDAHGQLHAALHIPGDVSGGTYTIAAHSEASGRTPITHLVIAKLAPSLVAVPTTAVPGTQVIVNGFGFSAAASVDVLLQGRRMTSVTTSAAGKFSVKATVPADSASGTYMLSARGSSGRTASLHLTVNRQVSTHFYFASFYTGRGYNEYIALLNPTAIQARASITYQLGNGTTRNKALTLAAHSRYTEDVNADLGSHVSAGATVAADVPIAAERMVFHGTDGAVVPGSLSPATRWYFANGNTSGKYREYIAIENPNAAPAIVSLRLLPTHHRAFVVTRTMAPTSRTTVKINSYVRDAVGVIVTSSTPVVANRTIFIHHGMTSKIGVKSAQRIWYFAAGPQNSSAKDWIGAINPNPYRTYITLHAYGPAGLELGTVKGWLRRGGRAGYLINRIAHSTDVSVVLSSSQPIVAEQTSYVGRLHNAATDGFGSASAAKTWQFAAVNTLSAAGDADTVNLFNPNLTPIPIVLQFMTAAGSTTERTYVVGPLGHVRVDVGSVMPNAQLGIVAASNSPFVATNRSSFNNGVGSDTSSGIHS